MGFTCLSGDKEDKQDSLMKGKDFITPMVSQAHQEHMQAGILHRGIVLSLTTFDRVNLCGFMCTEASSLVVFNQCNFSSNKTQMAYVVTHYC